MNTFTDFCGLGRGRSNSFETASSIEEIPQLKLKQIAESNLLPIVLDKLFPIKDYFGQLGRQVFINFTLSGETSELTLEEYFAAVQTSDLVVPALKITSGSSGAARH